MDRWRPWFLKSELLQNLHSEAGHSTDRVPLIVEIRKFDNLAFQGWGFGLEILALRRWKSRIDGAPLIFKSDLLQTLNSEGGAGALEFKIKPLVTLEVRGRRGAPEFCIRILMELVVRGWGLGLMGSPLML